MSTPETPARGPCVQWIDAADVAAVCDAIAGSDPSVYDSYAQAASDTLYALSGRQFPGLCETTVRPCECRTCPPDACCGCCHLSRVKLAGWPVRAVTEVLIDGAEVSGWWLDGHKWLVRGPDENGRRQTWPGCQRLDLPDTEQDTFSVTYSYGADPPEAGLLAAAELACQIATAATGGECALPPGTTRVTRQGITVDLDKAMTALMSLPLVSLFLETVNPTGARRRSSAWSPDIQPFARKVNS